MLVADDSGLALHPSRSVSTKISAAALPSDRIRPSINSAALAGPDWMGMLAAIGIEKGKPFKPDAKRGKAVSEAPGNTGPLPERDLYAGGPWSDLRNPRRGLRQ